MGQRIDHRGLKLPAPDQALIERMAEEGYTFMCESWKDDGLLNGAKPALPWKDVPERTRHRWLRCAKIMYAQVAIAGGAKSRTIREKRS